MHNICPNCKSDQLYSFSFKNHMNSLIDINPQKINKFIPGTGHAVVGTDIVKDSSIKNIIVMNKNYIDEIKKALNHEDKFNFICVDD